MKRIRAHWLITLCSLVLGCSGDESLTLNSATTSIPADGVTIVELSVDVEFRGGALPDGQRVTIATGEPLLFETRAEANVTGDGLRPLGEASIEVQTSGGAGRAFLLAPLNGPGTLTISASYTTPNKDVLSDTLSITVREPPLIAAGTEVGGTLGSVVPHFDFGCERVNVGAFETGREEIRIPCQLTLMNLDGESLPHTPVQFFAEAGTMVDRPADDRDPRSIEYVVGVVTTTVPRDVDPEGDELSISGGCDGLCVLTEAGSGLVPGAAEQNPRDGLVTLLAVVLGHEAFDDLNGSGTWEIGEPFIDEGEPFLDVDDDGIHNPLIDGLHCCDSNGNGEVDGPNGQWDSGVWLGRMTHILWTGPADIRPERSRFVPDSIEIPAGAQQTFVLIAVDSNFNPLPVFDDSDEINVDLDTSPNGRMEFVPDADPKFSLNSTLGLDLNARYPFFVFGRGEPVYEGVSQAGGRLEGREWSMLIRDRRSETSTQICTSVAWSLQADLRWTPGQGADGKLFDDQQALINGLGTLAALDADPCPPE